VEHVDTILDFLDEYGYNMSYANDGEKSFANEAYEVMREKAKSQNAFMYFNGNLHNWEKFLFRRNNILYSWSCVYAPRPYYIFEIVGETIYKVFNYEG